MKNALVLFTSIVGVILVFSLTIETIYVGGGFSNNTHAQKVSSVSKQSWTRKEFENLQTLDWDDETDQQYDYLLSRHGKADRQSDKSIDFGHDEKITQQTLTWEQKHCKVVLGFYRYQENGDWVLHDKTWIQK
ncbi:hypothetical protein [Weissella confusa]|uniref:Uncharacterized protein n=1 Tax=Weissella confusa TaxID=1583 RepID=A0A4Z0RWH2_WEICO|nr:hypothetical protein [Weissella confusa]TGE72784.1 hypothetical protein C6P11_05615 [Weissella confusa]